LIESEQTMTPTALQALRRLLFFTVQDAARLIASNQDQPQSVAEGIWQQWENGTLPIPQEISERMKELSDWRSDALAATAENIRIQITEKSGVPDSVFVIWYDTLEDWLSLPNREPVMWRLQQSVCASLMSMFSILRLVRFDPIAYHAWRDDREDAESLRAEWASTV
jgi:hypothetical protein